MPDRDLIQITSNLFSWGSISKIRNEATQFAASIIGQTVGNLWETSKIYVASFILLFFIIRFYERGIGSV